MLWTGVYLWTLLCHIMKKFNHIICYKLICIFEYNNVISLEIITILQALTDLLLAKMVATSQSTFLNAFSLMKNFVFWFEFHRSLFLLIQLPINEHWFRKWLVAEQVTSHFLNQCSYSTLTRICAIRRRWVKSVLIFCCSGKRVHYIIGFKILWLYIKYILSVLLCNSILIFHTLSHCTAMLHKHLFTFCYCMKMILCPSSQGKIIRICIFFHHCGPAKYFSQNILSI